MNDLITCLEQATEGSRDLDAYIRFYVVGDMTRCNFEEGCWHSGCDAPGCGKWLGMHDERRSYPRRWQDDKRLPHYTTYLDDASSLIPNGWVGNIEIGSRIALEKMRCELWNGEFAPNNVEIKAEASTPALALCIAALKATELWSAVQKRSATRSGTQTEA